MRKTLNILVSSFRLTMQELMVNTVTLLGGAADYAALIQRESAKWAGIVRVSGATAE